MPRSCFVVNEWLLEDLLGRRGTQARSESFRFLQILKRDNDCIAVLVDSPWMRKAFELARRNDPPARQLSRYLHYEIIRNSDCCIQIRRDDTSEIPDEVKAKSPVEDLYLVETYLSAKADLLITTDEKLQVTLSSLHGYEIRVMLRDAFYGEYLKKA
jgi:hypothetical protein